MHDVVADYKQVDRALTAPRWEENMLIWAPGFFRSEYDRGHLHPFCFSAVAEFKTCRKGAIDDGTRDIHGSHLLCGASAGHVIWLWVHSMDVSALPNKSDSPGKIDHSNMM